MNNEGGGRWPPLSFSMSASDRLEIHVVSHTHWDREWYEPAGRFRQRLVPVVDDLLDDLVTDQETHFLLDGQAILLHDYLAARPERREHLARLLAAGVLEAGPWYVLADELIPSGEALVRNLLAGVRTLRELGAAPPPVLYSPDAFGHPAALPMLVAGFGLRLCIVWRGLGGQNWPDGDTFRWRAPDGSSTLVYLLPPSGYEFGSAIPRSDSALKRWWKDKRGTLVARARTTVVLLPNGADHHARQRGLAEALGRLSKLEQQHAVRPSSLRSFSAALCAAEEGSAPVINGELRDSTGHAWTLQGTLAVRARLKRANATAERSLLRDAEPWNALLAFRQHSTREALPRLAWRRLLECHPHDTLCGCASDEVARAMSVRLEDVLAQARGIRDDALLDLLGHDRERAREQKELWRPVVIVRNRAARRRRGVADAELLRFARHVPVGPGSSTAPRGVSEHGTPSLARGEVCIQEIRRVLRYHRTESPRHYPDADLVEATRVAAWVDDVPGYGIAVLPLDWVPHSDNSASNAQATLPTDVEPVTAGEIWVANGLLRIEVEHGALTLRRGDGRGPAVSISFDDTGDAGDLYTYSGVGDSVHALTCRSAEVLARGPVRGTIRAHYQLLVPATSSRSGRSGDKVALTVSLSATVHAGEPFVRLHIRGVNTVRDHRLRVVCATALPGDDAWADAAFSTVRRSRHAPPPTPEEHPVATAPLARHVTIERGGDSVTILSDGLAEYEATPTGEVAITILRAVGELSREELPERPGHAGWPMPTPQAQEQGPFAARLGVLISGGSSPSSAMEIEHAAEDFLLPLVGATLRSALERYPDVPGLELEGDGLAFSCCKEREGGGGLVLRCVNLLDRTTVGRWRLAGGVGEAWMARLDETIEAPLDSINGEIDFEAPPRATVTIVATPGPPPTVAAPADS